MERLNVGIAVTDDLFTYKSVVHELPDGRGQSVDGDGTQGYELACAAAIGSGIIR